MSVSVLSGMTTPPAPGTPSGPGVGIRLNHARAPPRASNSLRYHNAHVTSTPDREKHKLDKIKTLIASDNTDLGEVIRYLVKKIVNMIFFLHFHCVRDLRSSLLVERHECSDNENMRSQFVTNYSFS